MAARRIRATPLHHDGHDYLTTAQVSRTLGVKPESVYAYVSRGLLRSVRIDGIRGSVFSIGEVEALMGRGGRTRPPSGAVERIRTQITLIDNDTLYYRGKNAVELATSVQFEQVCALLWTAEVSDYSPHPAVEQVRRLIAVLPRATTMFDAVVVATDGFRCFGRDKRDTTREVVLHDAALLIDGVIDALPPQPGAAPPRGTSRAERLWPALTSEPATDASIMVVNAALILLADHDLCTSTMAVRVAASARANIYAVISAGLSAIDGPLHGGAASLAYEFLGMAQNDPDGAVAACRRAGLPIPGFGHVVYQDRDPRAEALLELVPPPHHLIDAAGESFPNIDLALAACAHAFAMVPAAPEVIFALARMAGWTAHALEEYIEPQLRFRPIGVYTGIRPT